MINIIRKIAQQFSTNGRVDREDYISVGMMALEKAKKEYNPSLGASFKTFATTLIRNSITEEYQKNANNLKCSAFEYSNSKDAKDIVDFQNRTTIRINTYVDDGKEEHSPSGNGWCNENALISTSGIEPVLDEVTRKELNGKVIWAIEQLPNQYKEVVYKKIFCGETFSNIAEKQQISIPTAKLRLNKALYMIKEKLISVGINQDNI